jgi:CheY-like chemotaxis protein
LTKTKIYYIVDDDTDDQQFLREALIENDPNTQCFTAYDAQAALTNLKDALIPLPDAIFLDLNMPGLDGKQCLAELKRTPSLEHIPVVIYSTTSDKKEIQETLKMGASYFLIKRNSFNDLKSALSPIVDALALPVH